MRLKVVVRLRPTDDTIGLAHADHRVLYMKDPLRGHNSEFVFDKVFDGETKQDAVFQEVGMPLVDHVMQGYNACCLAYGDTGSGKTYSMYGRESMNIFAGSGQPEGAELGIIPRTCEMLSKAVMQVNRKADNLEASGATNVVRIKLFVSFMEIYMENVRDLGAAAQAHIKAAAARTPLYDGPPAGAGLPAFASADGGTPCRAATATLRDPADYVRHNLDAMEDASGMTFVKDLTYVEVTSLEDMLALLQAGYAVRSSACPIDLSSRSHTIFTVSVVTYRGDQQPVTGRLNFLDLAGSEKQSRTGPEGHRLREASAINKALTALGKVVVALSQAAAAPAAPLAAATLPRPTSLSNSGNPPSPGSPTGSSSGGRSFNSVSSPSTTSNGTSTNSNGAAATPHVPFRDAKLTRVLKDSLLGNSYICLLACVYPVFDEIDESAATLQFATKVLTNCSTPHNVNVNVNAVADPALVEDLSTQVTQLKDELEATHAHYQKLIEAIAGPSWRNDPGPLERAPGSNAGFAAAGAGLGAFAAALADLGKGASAGGAPGPGGAGGGQGRRGSFAGGEDRRRTSAVGGPDVTRSNRAPSSDVARGGGGAGGGHAVARSVMGGPTSGANASARITLLESQIRKLESQLAQARVSAQQYEERLTARKEEMDLARERMAGKEHAQFAEIKKLRAQVAELTKALEAERAESQHKLDDARRRSDDEVARLLKDIDTLRSQLAQVTGTVGSLVERHSAAITAEKRQREAIKVQATQMLQQQYNRGSEEHKAQLENLKQQSTFFLARRAEEVAELRHQMEAARAAHAAEKDALLAELDYLSSYSERVTEVVRRMEAGVVPVHERGNGVRAFRLPQRERPPRLDGARLAVLKERDADLHDRLTALSAATATATGSSYTLIGSASSSSLGGPGAGGARAGSSTSAAAGQTGGAAAAGAGGMASRAASSTAGPGAGTAAGPGATFGGWVGSSTPPSRGGSGILGPPGGGAGGAGAYNALGSPVDLEALRAQVEAELKAQVTAQVVGDLRSDKTVEYIRELEAQVARYRGELQSEKKRSGDMAVALRSVQRQHQRPESPMNRALATHTPAGTIKLTPNWSLGHSMNAVAMAAATAGLAAAAAAGGAGGSVSASGAAGPVHGALSSSGGLTRPATAGLVSFGERSTGFVSAPHSARRPATSTSMAVLTSSFRDNKVAIP